MELDLGLLRFPVSGSVVVGTTRGVLAQMVPHLQVVRSWGTTGIPVDLDVSRDFFQSSFLKKNKNKEAALSGAGDWTGDRRATRRLGTQ